MSQPGWWARLERVLAAHPPLASETRGTRARIDIPAVERAPQREVPLWGVQPPPSIRQPWNGCLAPTPPLQGNHSMVEVEGRACPHRALSSVAALLRRGHCGVIDEGTRSTRGIVAAERLWCTGGALFSLAPGCYRRAVAPGGARRYDVCSPEGISRGRCMPAADVPTGMVGTLGTRVHCNWSSGYAAACRGTTRNS